MFGGLITSIGVVNIADGGGLSVCCPGGFLDNVVVGGSIAVDGVCLTAAAIDGDTFRADLSAETMHRCAGWQSGQRAHLEKPLCMGEDIGGHFVSGHIDGVAVVISRRADDTGAVIFRIKPPASIRQMIAEKGSIALSGVSLTIGAVEDNNGECIFAVHVIPHTLQATTIGEWQPGQKINAEADLLARYCTRITRITASSH